MPLAYVALGANLDDPVTQVHAAFDALRGLPASRLLRTSSLYRTAPVGVHGQPDFINAVAQLETDLDAAALALFDAAESGQWVQARTALARARAAATAAVAMGGPFTEAGGALQ